MNKEETAQILAIVRSAYPNVKIQDAKATVNAWHWTLGDYSAETVIKAVRLHISTKKYFPVPSEIRDCIVRAELMFPGQLPAIQAPKNEKDQQAAEEYVEAFCKWIGFGCEPNDDVMLPNFLPYER